MAQASNGRLYGITSQGGNGYVNREDTSGAGVVFSFDPATSKYTKLLDFDYDNEGGVSYGSFAKASNGQLNAMTNSGGAHGAGVIFSLDPSKNVFTKVHDFDMENGANPNGNLLQSADGKLYGIAYQGGANSGGVIFSFDQAANNFNKLMDFNIVDGSNPYLGSAFIEVPESGLLVVVLLQFNGRNVGGMNRLNWQVSHEQNLAYYGLERSTNGQDYTEVTRVIAASTDRYVFTDNVTTVVHPFYYYRLKLVDTDAHARFSDVIRVDRDINEMTVAVSPNPFTNRLRLSITSPWRIGLRWLSPELTVSNFGNQQSH